MADRTQNAEGNFWQQFRRSLRGWIAERRDIAAPEPERELPDADEIVFQTLDPVAAPKVTLDSFGELTEDWIARQCDALCFDQAHWYTKNKQVGLLEANPVRISALTQGRSAYRQDISLQEGQIAATCSCRVGQNRTQPSVGAKYCRHVIAALLAYLDLQGLKHKAAEAAALDCLCPITRRPLSNTRTIYQCRQCKTSYSPEGWSFLLEADKGRCCTCHQQKTIAPLKA